MNGSNRKNKHLLDCDQIKSSNVGVEKLWKEGERVRQFKPDNENRKLLFL